MGKWGPRPSVIFEGKTHTFSDMETAANRYANWGLAQGLKKGDVIALMMENRTEYIMTWLGMAKIGVAVAMINSNLKMGPLVHCITVSAAKLCIFGAELSDNMRDVAGELGAKGVGLVCAGGACDFAPTMDGALAAASDARPVKAKVRAGLGMNDNFGFIYTSGTTGLPKAAVIKHSKMFAFGGLFCNAFCVSAADRVYCTLPLYHSAGGACGVGMMIYGGASIVIKRKFSARAFWTDCKDSGATVVQYIGELCRYLLAAPPSPADAAHKVRIAIGNGLRPDIWADFQKRFNIPEIGEFYGSTEGNAALVNHCVDEASRGCIGRMGAIMQLATGFKLVKFDVPSEEVVRDKATGFCIECATSEPGELLGPIKADDPIAQFQGYTDKAASEKKLLRNVFVKGDVYFRTGDLISRDEEGYYRFVDRIGDTFRWKGENVSTTEVAEVISLFKGVQEANVYGVAVPKMDGRACMCSMVLPAAVASAFDYGAFAAHLAKNLPAYAVPLFLRIQPEIEITGTFKHRKVELVKEGFDPAVVTEEPLYYYNPATKSYERIDAAVYQRIVSGAIKF